MKTYYFYILTNWTGEVMYVGVTNDMERRLSEHKTKAVKGFTQKYNLTKLVYYEDYSNPSDAIAREKEVKKWRREKKDNLVKTKNPNFDDLSEGWY